MGIYHFQTVKGKNPVFASDRYNVRAYARGHQIEIGYQVVNPESEISRQGLDQFKPDPTATEFLIRILAIFPFRVQDRNSLWDFISRSVVIADNKINIFFGGISNLINCLYATIQCNNQGEIIVASEVDSFIGDTIPFIIPIWDVG